MSETVIKVRDLHKTYGDVQAVRGIDLEIERGEVFALLGPNGAGKTTTVEILEGYRDRDRGEVEVLGVDPRNADAAWRARIGIVLQQTTIFDELTPHEIISHFARYYPHPLDVDEAIRLVGLEAKRDTRSTYLSGGQKRRLDVALGLVGNPDLIFLDEPTTGLDPQARRQTWAMVERLTGLGKTVVLTTHYLDEAEALASRAAVIVGGEIVASGTPRDIGGRAEATAVVRFVARNELAERALPRFDADTKVEVDVARRLVTIHTDTPTAVVTALAGWAADAGTDELPELSVARPTLEEVYLQMIAALRPKGTVPPGDDEADDPDDPDEAGDGRRPRSGRSSRRQAR